VRKKGKTYGLLKGGVSERGGGKWGSKAALRGGWNLSEKIGREFHDKPTTLVEEKARGVRKRNQGEE